MNTLPPPDPSAPSPGPLPGPDGSNRRRTATIAIVSSVLAVGGIVVGSQLVNAERSTLSVATPDTEAPVDSSSPDAAEPPEAEPADEPIDDTAGNTADDATDDFAAFDECLSDKVGVDLSAELDDAAPGAVDAIDQIAPGVWEAAESACQNLLPDDIRAEFEKFEAYEQCLSDQLGDLFPNGDVTDGWNGTVIVDSPDGGFGTVLDFGDGDGTITVTKSGDQITTETSGDVTTLDEPALDAQWEEQSAEWAAAHEACADRLPEGAEIFDGMFEGMDQFLGDMDLGEFEFGEFDLGELGELVDIGELGDLDAILEDGDVGQLVEEFERKLDEMRTEPQN
jgi:hypothetical protein